MKLYCHIGMPHTAADYIQSSLSANQLWLQERGVAYGGALAKGPSHDTLYIACAMTVSDAGERYGIESAEDQARLRERIGQCLAWEQAQLPDHVSKMVLSCEDLFGKLRHPAALQRLHDLLSAQFEEVELIIYVRRQDDTIMAAYTDAVRQGCTSETLAEFADGCMQGDRDKTLYLFFKRALQTWIDIWGRNAITLRRYSTVDFINGDLLHDVLGVILHTWDPVMTGFQPVSTGRSLISAPALSYLRQLNETLDETMPGVRTDANKFSLLQQLGNIELPVSPRPIMPAALSRRIMARFSNANQWLSARFASERAGPFFPERPDHPEYGNVDRLSSEEAVALSGQILASLARQQETARA